MLNLAATWILTYGMHSVVICLLTLAVLRAARLSPENRCVVWRSALFLPLLTASLAVYMTNTRGRDAMRISVIEPLRGYVPPSLGRQKVEMTVTAINRNPEQRVVEVHDPLASAGSLGIVLMALAASASGLLFRRVRTSGIRRALRARTVSQSNKSIAARMGIEISESDVIEVPIALRGREICIPRSTFNEMGDAERTSVLLHEIAHVERRDPFWMDVSRILSVVTWWQPLNRIVCERLELDTESAADERAVALGARPHALVAGLAHFAGLIDTGFAGAGAALLSHDSPLVARARLILDRRPRSESPGVRRLLAVTLVSVTVFLATLPVLTTAGAAPAPPGLSAAGPRAQFVEEENEFTIVRNDRQP